MTAASVCAAGGLHTDSWEALGTSTVLRYLGPPDPGVRAAVAHELEVMDAAASRFRPDSELTRVNRAGGARVAIGPVLAEAVALAMRAAEITGGAVDPTLGQWLVAAGYDRDWRQLMAVPADAPLVPRDRLIVRRRRRRLWEGIELDRRPLSLRLPRGVTLDLGATAKALAADRAAAAAHAAGADGVLVSLGGDIATCGRAPEGGWLIRVTDDHRAGPAAPGQTICIRSGGLATSSIVPRRWLHHGRPMHHILDPRTGAPVRTSWRTVSVAAATCADANIASTAALVAGAGGPSWLKDQGLPARLVEIGGVCRVQGGWPA